MYSSYQNFLSLQLYSFRQKNKIQRLPSRTSTSDLQTLRHLKAFPPGWKVSLNLFIKYKSINSSLLGASRSCQRAAAVITMPKYFPVCRLESPSLDFLAMSVPQVSGKAQGDKYRGALLLVVFLKNVLSICWLPWVHQVVRLGATANRQVPLKFLLGTDRWHPRRRDPSPTNKDPAESERWIGIWHFSSMVTVTTCLLKKLRSLITLDDSEERGELDPDGSLMLCAPLS